jgi:hypothetical protein
MGCSGYAGVAMDEEISERLWNVSCGFVEVSKED